MSGHTIVPPLGQVPTPTLTTTLKALGYTHEPVGRGYAHAIKLGTKEVFRGTAGAAWQWLRETDQLGDRGRRA